MSDITGRTFELVGASAIAALTGAAIDLSSNEGSRTMDNFHKCDSELKSHMTEKMVNYLSGDNSITRRVDEYSLIRFGVDSHGGAGEKADLFIDHPRREQIKLSFKHNSVETGSYSMSPKSLKSGLTKLPYSDLAPHRAVYDEIFTKIDGYTYYHDMLDNSEWRMDIFTRMAGIDALEFNRAAEDKKDHLCGVLSNIIGYTDPELVVLKMMRGEDVQEITGFHRVTDFDQATIVDNKLFIPVYLGEDRTKRTIRARYKFRSSRTANTSVKTSVIVQ